mmetsp:Transcript_31823/g.79399  ORF Transcript_31823/g.79399 Transcript_31823/m.79399 type:complete len:249 (+) Transcript_31823:19-765(+)
MGTMSIIAALCTAHVTAAATRTFASSRALVLAPRARGLRSYELRMGFADDLKSAFGQFGAQATAAKPEPPVVVKEDYTLSVVFLAGGVLLASLGSPFIYGAGSLPGVLILLLGILFTVQAGRIRFVFDETSFELKTRGSGDTDGTSGSLQSAGENIIVGGENRWPYESFVNYEFFPSGWLEKGWPPILVYFKETQTPSDQWGVGPGQSANSAEALARGARPGQVHFFPALCDCNQLKEQFELRGCKKL